MKYPNASKGMHKIVIAEIIALAASILGVMVSVYALPGIDASDPEHIGTTTIVMLMTTVVMYIAASILEIFGILSASKDEPAFKVSLYAITASIILLVLYAFFYQNETISLIISIAGDVAEFFLAHYIIHGIMHLADHLGRPEIAKKGKRIFRVIYIGIIFEVIVRIIEIIYGKERGEELAMPFDLVANILQSVEYIMFLIYIVKGHKMLKESKAE